MATFKELNAGVLMCLRRRRWKSEPSLADIKDEAPIIENLDDIDTIVCARQQRRFPQNCTMFANYQVMSPIKAQPRMPMPMKLEKQLKLDVSCNEELVCVHKCEPKVECTNQKEDQELEHQRLKKPKPNMEDKILELEDLPETWPVESKNQNIQNCGLELEVQKLLEQQMALKHIAERKTRELKRLREFSEILGMPKDQSLWNAQFEESDKEMDHYLEQHPYKVGIKLDKNRFGKEGNSHVSLSFMIMKGEFDDSLDWPFPLKVTLKMVNQKGGRDIIETIIPSANSISFQQPVQEINSPVIFPCFASYAELGDYMDLDGTILIQCHAQPLTIACDKH